MTVALPSADRTRAIVVGIEHYPGLGPSFDSPGAAKGALSFARWLVVDRKVQAANVQLWLSLRDGSEPTIASRCEGLGEAVARKFDWPAFRAAMAEPDRKIREMADGGFLIVYFCGHGVVSGARAEQYLVLPEATEKQFRCFETNNWRELFRGSGWERFTYQLWVIDACRNQWGDTMRPIRDEWNPGEPQPVRQCAMFACAIGSAAQIDSKQGPRFTRELLTELKTAQATDDRWPAFDEALKRAAARLRDDPAAGQSPTLSIGEDWFGIPMVGAGMAGASPYAMLSAIDWPYGRFKPYVIRALAASAPDDEAPVNLAAAIDRLLDAAPRDGVPPLLEFAERVARAVPSPALQAWVAARLPRQHKAELDARLAADACQARLLLWYRDDGAKPVIEGELEVLDAGSGVQAWPRAPAKVVVDGDIGATIGQWLHAVYLHVGPDMAIDLLVELYLPRALLTANSYDTAEVPLGDGDRMRLGDDHPALLRCTDRYKAPTKLSRWRRHAPRILARLGSAPGDRLRWADANESVDGLRGAYLADDASAPVWLGFEPTVPGGEAPLDLAVSEGLPAVVWLCTGTDTEARDALRAGLQELLRSPLDQLPARLVAWRARYPSGAAKAASLLLDDPARMPALWTSWTQPGA